MIFKRMAERWRNLVKGASVPCLWSAVWLAAISVPFLPPACLAVFAVSAWLSAAVLAPARFQGKRLLAMAALFWILWGALLAVMHMLSPSSLRPAGNLALWLPLGLHLMLAKTPLELALATGRLLRPFLGPVNSQKAALALALLSRLIPRLLVSAMSIKLVVKRRGAGLSVARRLVVWAGAMIRESMQWNEESARALLKRWPWSM